VGRATAARTLGGYGYVSPELRERVLAAAEDLGYRANALARSMSTGITHTLGVIVADIGNPFFAGVVRGISDTSRERGFDTIVLSTHESLDEEIAAMNVLIDKRVDFSPAGPLSDLVSLCRGVMRCPLSKCPRMPPGAMPYRVPTSIQRATIGRTASFDRSYFAPGWRVNGL
jgi:hypothetical protein